jgi:hypothetical protein
MSVISPSALNVSKITFSPVKIQEKTGARFAYVNYGGDNKPLVVQVGSLGTAFGLSKMTADGKDKFSVDLKLYGYDNAQSYPKVAAIYNALTAVDEYMIDQAVKNSKAWFKGEKSREVISELYTPTVKFARDAEGNPKPYPPNIKVKMPYYDGKFQTVVTDDKGRQLNDIPLEDLLVKGCEMTVLMQCTGVWFSNGKYTLSWKANRIRLDKMSDSMRAGGFLDEEGDAEEEEAAPAPKPAAKAAPAAKPSQQNAFAALHDDDEEEVDDEAALAPPAPAPKAAAAAAPVAPVAEEEEEPEDAAPVPVPAKKTTITKKKIVAPVKK